MLDRSEIVTPQGEGSGIDRERMAACVARIAASADRAAFSEVFAVFAPRLKSYMVRLGADGALAEELVQEVLLTVWRKAGQYDPAQASVSTWIFRIARNRRIDAHRRTHRPELDPEEPALQPSAAEAPDAAFERNTSEANVREALKSLPHEQFILLQSAFYEGLSHSEIARLHNLPLGTVKSRIRLAFNKLRGLLPDRDKEDRS